MSSHREGGKNLKLQKGVFKNFPSGGGTQQTPPHPTPVSMCDRKGGDDADTAEAVDDARGRKNVSKSGASTTVTKRLPLQ